MDENIRNKVEYLAHKKPDKLAEVVKEMYYKAPHDVEFMIEQFAGGEHLTNKEDYEKATKELKWIDNRGQGAKWEIDEILRLAQKTANIDFEEVDYTEFEFAYLVNLLYAMFCKVFVEITYYLRMAKAVFEYCKISEKQHYGDFFKPIQQDKDKHHANNYRYEYENRKYDPRYEEENREYNRSYNYENEEARRRYRNENEYSPQNRRY